MERKIIYLKKHKLIDITIYRDLIVIPLHFENQYSFELYDGEGVAMVVHYFQVVL